MWNLVSRVDHIDNLLSDIQSWIVDQHNIVDFFVVLESGGVVELKNKIIYFIWIYLIQETNRSIIISNFESWSITFNSNIHMNISHRISEKNDIDSSIDFVEERGLFLNYRRILTECMNQWLRECASLLLLVEKNHVGNEVSVTLNCSEFLLQEILNYVSDSSNNNDDWNFVCIELLNEILGSILENYSRLTNEIFDCVL